MFARDSEFGRGWPVVSAAAVGVGLGLSPLPFYTLGVFVAPLVQEFGWTPAPMPWKRSCAPRVPRRIPW